MKRPGIRVPLILCAVATLVVGFVALLWGPLARGSTPAYEGPPTWQMTASMSTVRGDHTATLLRNGTMLVVGGYVDSGRVLASAEVYNPQTGRWTLTGRMHTARSGHLAALLPDGRVLVVGGDCCCRKLVPAPSRRGVVRWRLAPATPRKRLDVGTAAGIAHRPMTHNLYEKILWSLRPIYPPHSHREVKRAYARSSTGRMLAQERSDRLFRRLDLLG
jgi:hypothetical protein